MTTVEIYVDDTVWGICIRLPERFRRETCEFVLDNLEYEGFSRENVIPRGKMQEVLRRVKHHLVEYRMHKRCEQELSPSPDAETLLSILTTTIDGMQVIKG